MVPPILGNPHLKRCNLASATEGAAAAVEPALFDSILSLGLDSIPVGSLQKWLYGVYIYLYMYERLSDLGSIYIYI